MNEFDRQRAHVVEAIRATGRRVTTQRVAILEALEALPGHQSVERIHGWVQEHEAGAEMALSTVYRTLDALVEIGLVTAIDDGRGSIRYEWAGEDAPHHHLLCEGCGHRVEVSLDSVAEVEREVRRRHGFEAAIRHLAIRGVCGDCREPGRA